MVTTRDSDPMDPKVSRRSGAIRFIQTCIHTHTHPSRTFHTKLHKSDRITKILESSFKQKEKTTESKVDQKRINWRLKSRYENKRNMEASVPVLSFPLRTKARRPVQTGRTGRDAGSTQGWPAPFNLKLESRELAVHMRCIFLLHGPVSHSCNKSLLIRSSQMLSLKHSTGSKVLRSTHAASPQVLGGSGSFLVNLADSCSHPTWDTN